jgi:hypothetical protein
MNRVGKLEIGFQGIATGMSISDRIRGTTRVSGELSLQMSMSSPATRGRNLAVQENS